MSQQIAHAFTNNPVTHIVEGGDSQGPIKTKCGRTLKNYSLGHSGVKDCRRCGTPEDFEAIHAENHRLWLEREARRKEENEQRQQRLQRRLEKHRALMAQFQEMLIDAGAEIEEVRELAAGGHFVFVIDGVKFELSGDVWK